MRAFVISVVVLLLSGCSTFQQGSPEYERVVQIQTMIDSVKTALGIVESKLGNQSSVTLIKAQLIIKTVAETNLSGETTFWVVSGGGSKKDRATNQIAITLVPSETKQTPKVSADMRQIAETLANSIIIAVEGVASAESGSYPMKLARLEIHLGLLVNKSLEGGAGYKFEIIPIGIGAKKGISEEDVSILNLEFSGV